MTGSIENITYGDDTWASLEGAFMAEKASLPHQLPSDCAQNFDAARNYCAVIGPFHNWVGLAITSGQSPAQNSSGSVTYYDQLFGDLYGMVDTTVIAPEPKLNTVASLFLSNPTYPGGPPDTQTAWSPSPSRHSMRTRDVRLPVPPLIPRVQPLRLAITQFWRR
jgi:hypothetical protein